MLAEEYGKDRKAYHLTADYTWGWTQEELIKNATEELGWKTVAAVRTPLGAGDFSQYITPVLNSGADVLILNHYGKDMVNSLTQAVQFGLRDKQVNGKKFEIVVPLFSELMAQGAGDAVKGILGTANWDWKLDDEATKAFTKSFGQEYGTPPSQAAQTCYVQALLYADAVRTGRHLLSRRRSSRRSRASSSTAWATARRSTAPRTTSASRTCWSCAARRTRRTSST